MNTEMVPAYRAVVAADSSTVTGLAQSYTPQQQGDFSYELDYMPSTGFQTPIGLLPTHDMLYLVANSIVLCASGWIAQMFGRKNFFMVCIALFTVSSLMCGFAWNLQALLIFRLMQGLAGGGMTPVAQSILAAAFPPAKRGQGFALYGIAVVVAPAVGPTLGGWLSDNLSWHWCFLINVPVGMITLVLIHFIIPSSPEKAKEREKLWAKGPNFDIVGFLLIVTFLGGLELVLDRGQIDDWFGSGFIVASAAVSATAFLLFTSTTYYLWHQDASMQPSLMAETSRPRLPSLRFGIDGIVVLISGLIIVRLPESGRRKEEAFATAKDQAHKGRLGGPRC